MRIQPSFVLPDLAGSLYDRFVCTRANFARQSRRSIVPRPAALKFSVAIPIHNRGRFLYRPLFNLLGHPGVSEIVIFDDCSAEDDYAQLEKTVGELETPVPIRLLRQSFNRKALVNKRCAVEQCREDWVLLLDSDNTAFRSFLDALAQLSCPRENFFYCASFAFPRFRFQALGYEPIDFPAACRMTADGRLRRFYLINDGNCLVNRQTYLEASGKLGDPVADQADAMLVNYELLSMGGALQLLRETTYYHRVEAGSRWIGNAAASKTRALAIFDRLVSNRRSDEVFRDSLRKGSRDSG